MASLIEDFKGAFGKLEGQWKQFDAKAQTTLKKCKTALKQAEGYKAKGPNIKNKGWSKKAEELGADKKIVTALKKTESAGTRASCVAALKALKGEKKLKEIEKEIESILKKDETAAKQIAGIRAKVEAQLAGAQKLEGTAKIFQARVKKMEGMLGEIEKEMKAASKQSSRDTSAA